MKEKDYVTTPEISVKIVSRTDVVVVGGGVCS